LSSPERGLLEYNCGILINIAGTVRHGVGYWFAFRYLSVHAASDPAGHAAFVEIRRSVEFPHRVELVRTGGQLSPPRRPRCATLGRLRTTGATALS